MYFPKSSTWPLALGLQPLLQCSHMHLKYYMSICYANTHLGACNVSDQILSPALESKFYFGYAALTYLQTNRIFNTLATNLCTNKWACVLRMARQSPGFEMGEDLKRLSSDKYLGEVRNSRELWAINIHLWLAQDRWLNNDLRVCSLGKPSVEESSFRSQEASRGVFNQCQQIHTAQILEFSG